MFVETRSPEPLGSQVGIAFHAADGEMTAIGEVRYICHLMARLGGSAARRRGARNGRPLLVL